MSGTDQKMVIYKAGQVIDATGNAPIKNGAVIVEGKKIAAVCRAAEVGVMDGAETVDLGQEYTLMPGLMDIHLHLSAHNAITFNNYRIAHAELSPERQELYELLHAQIMFEMGFTTLRAHPWPNMFCGHNSANVCAVRDAFAAGIFIGPRMIAGGYATMTGSHLDLISPRSMRREPDATADGPWELRKLARKQLRLGVDFIKTCASGGGGTDAEDPEIRNMTQEELDAVVDEAHCQNKHCSCHCFTPFTQKMAMKAGVDTIEHCVFTDDAAIEQLVKTGTPLIPTLLHRCDWSIDIRSKMGTSEFTLSKMRRIQPYTEATFKRYLAAGVTLAMGTDTQLEPYMGSNAKELEIYVNFGMKPMDAILTATRNAAKAIWVDKITGTLVPGKFADMIAVAGDPLANISILHDREKIALVMKEGRVWVDRRPGFPRRGVINDPNWGWKKLY